MDKLIQLFMEQIKKGQKSVEKEDIYAFLQDRGIECKKTLAKDKMLNLISENGREEEFFNEFSEFLYIPSWEIGKYFEMDGKQIDTLHSIGVIQEEPKKDSFWSTHVKSYIDYNTYPFVVLLKYGQEQLKKAYENAYPLELYALRIETKTRKQSQEITEKLSKCFDMVQTPAIYEHRNSDGFYTYYKIKLLNDSIEQENRLLVEISTLKAELSEKEKHINKLQDTLNELDKRSPLERFTEKELREELERKNKQIKELEALVAEKTSSQIVQKNLKISNLELEIKSLQKAKEENQTYEQRIREACEKMTIRINKAKEEAAEWERKYKVAIDEKGTNIRKAGRKVNKDTEEEMFRVAIEIQKLLAKGYKDKDIIEQGLIEKYNHNKYRKEPICRDAYYKCKKLWRKYQEQFEIAEQIFTYCNQGYKDEDILAEELIKVKSSRGDKKEPIHPATYYKCKELMERKKWHIAFLDGKKWNDIYSESED